MMTIAGTCVPIRKILRRAVSDSVKSETALVFSIGRMFRRTGLPIHASLLSPGGVRTTCSAALIGAALGLAGPSLAQAPAKEPAAKERPNAFGALGSNKEPIKIDADRLDVFDKESRAVFAGNVVAVQGDSTIKCTTMTVFYESRAAPGAAKPAAPAAQGADNSIRKIDCKGPVTIVSKTQAATGDNATFDRIGNKVLLIGNVTLSDGPNVTRGERIVYDLNSGIANVETAPGGRVKALFVPGSNAGAAAGEGKAEHKADAKTESRPKRPAAN
jgi:lipopolysaccharide export system protein LptA